MNKKVIIFSGVLLSVIALVSIVIGVFSMHQKLSWREEGRVKMMRQRNMMYFVPQSGDEKNQFTVPQDAARTAEIAMVVGNLENVKKNIAALANENGGNIHASYVSYTSNDIKNGSMVIQIPENNFDKTFAALHSLGLQIVEESTQKVERPVYYPMQNIGPQDLEKTQLSEQQAEKNSANASGSSLEAQGSPEAPKAIFPQPRNNAYIRVIFVDYGYPDNASVQRNYGYFNMMNGEGTSITMSKKLIIALAIKILLLAALIGVLIHLFRRNFHALRKARKEHKEKNSTRQIIKTRPRIVKIQKRTSGKK